MSLIVRHAAGSEYLTMITDLLQRIRLASPEGGLWEAADLQWAWRSDQHPDPLTATFWIDGAGRVVGAAVLTDRGETLGSELIVGPDDSELIPTMWQTVLDRAARRSTGGVDVSVDNDDTVTIALALDAGFAPDPEVYVSCWLDASDRPKVTDIADGYRLRSRADVREPPHHMIKRSGGDVEQRLSECSLYEASLDLFVEAPDGSVAAYGLFWPDPVTRVGLVEPMRTEDEHQNRGLARHILTAGIEGLARAGCSRIKITFMDDNPVSEHVYLSSGFQASSFAQTYRRSG